VNNAKTPEPPSSLEPRIEENPLWDPVAAEALAAESENGESSRTPPQPAAMAFRYRSFTVNKDITLVARTTVHGVQRKRNEGSRAAAGSSPAAVPTSTPLYLQIYTVLEWDPKMAGTPEWRSLVDTQRGSVISTEIKNNSHKLAKFTASALLAGVDNIRLGLVARASRTDPYNHNIVGTHAVAPPNFATSLQLQQTNMWGILKWLVDMVRKHAKNLQEGVPDEDYSAKFVLARDPVTPVVHFYNVPVDAFDREEEEEEEVGLGEEETTDW